MRNRFRKMIGVTGILCAMSLTVCACGGNAEDAVQAVQQPGTDEAGAENGLSAADTKTKPEDNASAMDTKTTPENDASAADTNTEPKNAGSKQDTSTEAEGDMSGADGENAPGVWDDGAPVSEGDIKVMKDGKFTMIEAMTERSEDGDAWAMMASPAPGADDSGFDKVTVFYDEKTLFAVKTIQDGGATFEMEEATAADLAAGLSIAVWGSGSDSEIKATQICIVKVE